MAREVSFLLSLQVTLVLTSVCSLAFWLPFYFNVVPFLKMQKSSPTYAETYFVNGVAPPGTYPVNITCGMQEMEMRVVLQASIRNCFDTSKTNYGTCNGTYIVMGVSSFTVFEGTPLLFSNFSKVQQQILGNYVDAGLPWIIGDQCSRNDLRYDPQKQDIVLLPKAWWLMLLLGPFLTPLMAVILGFCIFPDAVRDVGGFNLGVMAGFFAPFFLGLVAVFTIFVLLWSLCECLLTDLDQVRLSVNETTRIWRKHLRQQPVVTAPKAITTI